MIHRPCSLGHPSPRLLAVLVVLLAPALAHAETMIFRNECRVPVVVHTTSVVNGKLVRNKPYLLRFGEYSPKIKINGLTEVSIYDGRVPNLLLYRNTVREARMPLSFGIIPDRRPLRVNVVPRPLPPPPKAPRRP
jgi:hypothetical protein